jgi:hypothetical protein
VTSDTSAYPVPSFPDARTLARLVSNVTETLFGIAFEPADENARSGLSICTQMVVLPIHGVRDISVVLSFDTPGGEALTCALRRCPASELTTAAIADAMGELLNMIAGQIQSELEIDQPLGLPRHSSLEELSRTGGVGFEDSILLTSKGLGELNLWVYETAQPPEPGIPAPNHCLFRSLFARRRSGD